MAGAITPECYAARAPSGFMITAYLDNEIAFFLTRLDQLLPLRDGFTIDERCAEYRIRQ